MFRIRFHGRGGQGMKTASRILGTAFFLEGYQVQDAPRYGAERRGAPIFAYVRADTKEIYERGVITKPDLIIVADESLIPIPAAGVLSGVEKDTVILINSSIDSQTWKERLNTVSHIISLPLGLYEDQLESKYIGAICTGAAARLIGKISITSLEDAIQEELESMNKEVIEKNLFHAKKAYDQLADLHGCVKQIGEISSLNYITPDWINMPFEEADISSPSIYGALTSMLQKTGLWRTLKPEIDYTICRKCWWLCSTFCPDSTIQVDGEGYPQIDFDHCKGCMICLVNCPAHAIEAVAENSSKKNENMEKSGVKT